MANERFLDIPSLKGILIAVGVIVVFMFLAYGLYCLNGGSSNQYWLKVGDSFINGAIVGILFAILKAMFDLPKWLQERAARKRKMAQSAPPDNRPPLEGKQGS